MEILNETMKTTKKPQVSEAEAEEKGKVITFKAKIAKMGDSNRIIWIPLALHEMIRDFEDEDLLVTIKKTVS